MSSETNDYPPGIPPSDELLGLLRRHLVLACQMRLASKHFGDLSGLPQEYVAAALVVQEASAELDTLHVRLHEWYTRQIRRGAFANPAKVSLILKEYALDKKVSVIRVVREVVPGCSLTMAKALVERQLPAPVADGLAPEQAEIIRQKFEAAGAICRISVNS